MRFTYINSALVSAQNRQRFYVTNFGDIEQPEDRGSMLRDILESGVIDREKSYPLLTTHQGNARDYFQKQHAQIVCEPINPLASDKARCVTAGYANKGAMHILESNYSENPSKQQWDCVAEPIRIGDIGSTAQAHRVYSCDGKSVTLSANGGGQGGKTGLYATPINVTEDGKAQTIKATYSFTSIPNICCYSSTYGSGVRHGAAADLQRLR